jgi:hypothetical protein
LHRSLGKLIDVSVVDGAVLGGRIELHRTAEAEQAAALIASGKVALSTAYAAEDTEICDANNRRVDPNDTARADEPGIVFEVARWQIAALALVPG